MIAPQTVYPDSVMIAAGDFNHIDLKLVIPKFYTNMNFSTNENNVVD